MRSLSVVLLAGWMAAGIPGMAGGQTTGAALHVRTADGRTRYYIGERIPLALDFTASGNKEFEITTANYDRSGRMMHESFEVQPKSGCSDPLQDYFASLSGFLGGGLSGLQALTPKPATIALDLNEWVRFDRPGTYRVVVVSHRLSQISGGRHMSDTGGSAVRSEPIELRIVRAPADWQSAKLTAILAELRAEPPSTNGVPSERRKAALADLRFLATPAAVQVMALHLREEEQDMEWPAALGLAGLQPRLRPYALAALEKEIEDPFFPVSSWFLQLLPLMEQNESESAKPSPQNDDAKAAQERFDELKQRNGEVWERVFKALPDKQGRARVATAEMLSQAQWCKPSGEDQRRAS